MRQPGVHKLATWKPMLVRCTAALLRMLAPTKISLVMGSLTHDTFGLAFVGVTLMPRGTSRSLLNEECRVSSSSFCCPLSRARRMEGRELVVKMVQGSMGALVSRQLGKIIVYDSGDRSCVNPAEFFRE